MKHSKHAQKGRLDKKKIIIILVIVVILVALSFFLLSNTKDMGNQLDSDNENEEIQNIVEEPTEEQEEFEIVDTSDIPNTKQGYNVLGKIVIEKIGVQTCILEKTTKDSLQLGATKFWGPNINEPRQCMSDWSQLCKCIRQNKCIGNWR